MMLFILLPSYRGGFAPPPFMKMKKYIASFISIESSAHWDDIIPVYNHFITVISVYMSVLAVQ